MDADDIKNLLRTKTYPEATASVQLIQTHVSFIFITDEYVYKIKKSVDLGFLNFSTIDRRRFYCNEEVRLNRRICPDTYLGVVEVRESPSGATLVGDGKVMDYAVKMKRLPRERMMDIMLGRGELGAEHIRLVSAAIAEFHRRAERGEGIDQFGSPEVIGGNWEENFQQAKPFSGKTISAADLGLIRGLARRFMEDNVELFARRVAEGFIRDCDGDLHLENICLTDPVCIFDCIEFNDRFRYGDTAADVAFLLMDLDFHRATGLASLLQAEYERLTGDRDLPLLLDFYKSYRAFVRGKVESLKMLDPFLGEREGREAERKAKGYFRLSRGYLLRQRLSRCLIITCGLMGSGKSSIADALSLELGLEVFSSDIVRKAAAGLQPGERSLDDYGAGIYTPENDRAVYDSLKSACEKALTAGRSVIADATFRRRAERMRFAGLAVKCGVPFYILNTRCDEVTVRQRLERRENDPCNISDGRWELYQRQREAFEPLGGEQGIVVTLDTTLQLEDNINTILAAMEIVNG